MKFIDETGNVYGRLKVLRKDIEKSKLTGKTYWLCECNCKETNKNIVSVSGDKLRSKTTKSCGCLKYEKTSESSTNPLVKSLRQRWDKLHQRCNNKENEKYKNYGARGIKCLWTSFEEFKNDMYESFVEHIDKFGIKNTTLDRIDVNGNYCKENCRWATLKEQSNNKSNNTLLTFNNKTLTLAQWAELTGISYGALLSRLRRGWSVERTLITPQQHICKGKQEIIDNIEVDNFIQKLKDNNETALSNYLYSLMVKYKQYLNNEYLINNKECLVEMENICIRLKNIIHSLSLL